MDSDCPMFRKPLAGLGTGNSRLPLPASAKRTNLKNDEPASGIKKPRVEPTGAKRQKTEPAQTPVGIRRSTSTSSVTALRSKQQKSAAPTPKSRLTKNQSSSTLGSRTMMGPPATSARSASTRSARPALKAQSAVRPESTASTVRSSNNQNLNNTVLSTGAPKKRPGWDLKGRLQDMEVAMQRQNMNSSSLANQLTTYNERIAHLESLNQKLSGDVAEKEMASETAVKEIQDIKTKMEAAESQHQVTKRNLQRELEDLQFSKGNLERQKTSLEDDLAASQTQVRGLKSSVAELTSAQTSVRAELDNAQAKLAEALGEIARLKETVKAREDALTEQTSLIENLMTKEREHETERRRLHNTVQELKGNIRVFCRIRPLLGEETLGNNGVVPHMAFPDMDGRVLELEKLSETNMNESALNSTRAAKYEFSFDRVFQPGSTQADVFDEISQLVQSALDGYNVCIFAYGQTGSGKTFTMEGSLETLDTQGMIPRAVRQIFASAQGLEHKGWQYTYQASMLEIYNETIRDLLGKDRDEKLDIKIAAKGESEVFVSGLTVVNVTSEDKIQQLLKKASVNRAVAETKCNERSSRSHSVFTLKLNGRNTITGESSKGTLNLVDLAGSERVKDSGSEGQRLVEAQKINSSLSNLGNVIMALGKGEKHVPYRNSKLTYLLQNSLGGNSKTLMFVNISPKEECFGESLNSLRFATKVNQCNIGTAQKKK